MANFIAGWTMFFLILFGLFMVAAPIVAGPIKAEYSFSTEPRHTPAHKLVR